MEMKETLKKFRGWFPSEPKFGFSNLNQKRPARNRRSPSDRERLTGGLGAFGGGLVLQGIVFHIVPHYPLTIANVLFIGGIPFLVAAFLVNRKQKTGDNFEKQKS
jgi:hypothetical protein